jgi:hypothetical protein
MDRELTFGEKAVGLKFNPSGDERVNKVKELYSEIIDIMHDERRTDGSDKDPEVNRLCSVAITEAQGAQMWAVKALTLGK